VLDQFNQPVVNADVVYGWTTIGPVPDPKRSMRTDTNGGFQITGIQGKVLDVSVTKAGYVFTDDSHQGFEYALFFQPDFNIPDPNHPIQFHLHELQNADHLYKYNIDGETGVGRGSIVLDVEQGTLSPAGQLSFSAVIGAQTNQYGSDFVVAIRSLNGAAIALGSGEFMSQAPESGYLGTYTIVHKCRAPDYNKTAEAQFYVKTGSGRYASIFCTFRLLDRQKTFSVSTVIYYNPNGSRSLEFDSDKWINR